jgi:UDP-glucose-4-epimerase GalE
MRILVTGGAGYIGSLTAQHLADAGHGVVVLDDLRNGHRAAVGVLPLVVGDVRDVDLVASTIDEHAIDAVVHFAALKSVEDSVSDPGSYFDNNVGGTLGVLRAMARTGVRRLVFSSSCAVYGTPDASPVDETAAIRPMNAYGESKAVSERLLPWFDSTHGIRSAALRYFNAAGAADDGSRGEDWAGAQNLVPVVLQTAAGRRAVVRIFGTDHPTPDGTAIRDYIHVLDLADAHLAALELTARMEPGQEVFNLGSGSGFSVKQVLDSASLIVGRAIPHRYGARRAGDPPVLVAAADRARKVLGWEASRGSLGEMIGSAWQLMEQERSR